MDQPNKTDVYLIVRLFYEVFAVTSSNTDHLRNYFTGTLSTKYAMR